MATLHVSKYWQQILRRRGRVIAWRSQVLRLLECWLAVYCYLWTEIKVHIFGEHCRQEHRRLREQEARDRRRREEGRREDDADRRRWEEVFKQWIGSA